jgi:hypothetical protein
VGDLPEPADSSARLLAHRFVIEADADGPALTRISAMLELGNCCPSSLRLKRRASDMVRIYTVLTGLTAIQADLIRRKLDQLSCVRSVDLSERRTAPVGR